MNLRFQAALIIAKLFKFTINKTGGGATAAPGLASLYFEPKILNKLAAGLKTTILVTGTNGKTTTSRLIGNHLDKLGIDYIHNRQGSNLERGIISSFLKKTTFFGKLHTTTALFEVDEAALPSVITKLSPTVLVITNLFRDQLDRYGEVDNIRKSWEKCIANLDENTTLILNADDPTLAYLGENVRCKVIYFGLNDTQYLNEEVPLAVDNIRCPKCKSELKYRGYFISHQGHYSCLKCGFKRPETQVVAAKIKTLENLSTFDLNDKNEINLDLTINTPGLYNIYNCLSSYAALKESKFNLDSFALTASDFKPVFGRAEKLSHQGRNIIVALAKNPTGFNEIINTYLKKEPQTVLILINDFIADGRDVSWLWDVNFEQLKPLKHKFLTSGVRSADMALRLKYAGIENYENISTVEDALEKGLSSLPQEGTLLIIPTYTAMLSLKKLFVKKGISGEFWED